MSEYIERYGANIEYSYPMVIYVTMHPLNYIKEGQWVEHDMEHQGCVKTFVPKGNRNDYNRIIGRAEKHVGYTDLGYFVYRCRLGDPQGVVG